MARKYGKKAQSKVKEKDVTVTLLLSSEAIGKAGYKAGSDFLLGLDVATVQELEQKAASRIDAQQPA